MIDIKTHQNHYTKKMIFNTFKKIIDFVAQLTPNSFIPKLGEKISHGKLSRHDCAELYLVSRFLFATLLATILPKSLIYTFFNRINAGIIVDISIKDSISNRKKRSKRPRPLSIFCFWPLHRNWPLHGVHILESWAIQFMPDIHFRKRIL